MAPPTLTPTQKPFKEAIEFHRARVPMSSDAFATLSNEAKLRAFTVSGLARQSSIVEVYNLAEEALQTGMTMDMFRERLTAYLEANDWASLPAWRIDLIFRQAIGQARAIGRYEQMSDPDVVAMRPFWMYSLGPDDDRTTDVCRRLQGFIAPASSEVWNHIYPPNHFNERHSVVSLSAAQAKSTGRIYEGPDSDQYPFVNGGRILPDPGFDAAPGLLESDGEQLLAEIANLAEEIEAKTPADYGLPTLDALPDSAVAELPPLDAPLPVKPTADDLAAAWSRFQAALNMPADADSTVVVDVDGDGVIVNRQTFDHLLGLDTQDPAHKIDAAARAQFFSTLRPTLEDPVEVWWSPRKTDAGTVAFTKVYIGIYRDAESGRSLQVFVVRSPQGWLMWSGYPKDAAALEAVRRGYLSFRSYGRSSAAA